ncbi:hypothetical protein [Paenisporosarcina indica]|uniref:hypothetical protein n=1 Tax=Paenisporosarcina indica TaxID=650093 RepID=UPI000AFDB74E|nr:hypothetical protein [Paenisporosarcina indica]
MTDYYHKGVNNINKNIEFSIFTFILVLILVGCSDNDKKVYNTTADIDESTTQNTPVVSRDSSTDSPTNTVITSSTEENILQDSPEYVANNEGELSFQDSETAFEMCVRALTDYFKAVWNGSAIELDTFIDNENLKQYTQKKIQSQNDLYSAFTDSKDEVQNIEVGAWEVEYTDDVDGSFLYLKLPAEIKKTVGSYGEVIEFLVRNVNGKLVIVDWYTGAKDSYDFLVRGENLTIDNPNIWNDSEWVKKLNNKQMEFSGSTR